MTDASVARSREYGQSEERERIFKKQYERRRRISTENQNPSRRMNLGRDRADLLKVDAASQRAKILEILFNRFARALERSVFPKETGPHRIERCGVSNRCLVQMMLERATVLKPHSPDDPYNGGRVRSERARKVAYIQENEFARIG